MHLTRREACGMLAALAMESGPSFTSDYDQSADGDTVRLLWKTAAGELSLAGGAKVNTVTAQDKLFQAWLNGKPVPEARLSDAPLG